MTGGEQCGSSEGNLPPELQFIVLPTMICPGTSLQIIAAATKQSIAGYYRAIPGAPQKQQGGDDAPRSSATAVRNGVIRAWAVMVIGIEAHPPAPPRT